MHYEEHYHDAHDRLYDKPTQRRITRYEEPAVGAAAMAAAEEPGLPEPPPRAGAGSGRDAWAAYATAMGMTVTDDLSRDDIIALFDQTKE